MIGGLFKSTSRLAMIAAAGLVSGGVAAQAADLGGNCCADLEERVAELEATTARKGNRQMSLKIYGWVNRALLWHDDDFAATAPNFSSRDNGGRSQSRFGFVGSASLNADVSVGYHMEFGFDGDGGVNTESGVTDLYNRQMHVWIKSAQLGTLKIGQANNANEGITEIALATVMGQTNQEATAVSGIAAAVSPDFDGTRTNGVHYISPTLAGFALSASYFHDVNANTNPGEQESDGWAVALRYAGEFGAIRVAAGVAYYEESKGTGNVDEDGIHGSVSVMHVTSGLFVNFAAGDQNDFGGTANSDLASWHLEAGIKQKWSTLGATTISGWYGERNRNANQTLAGIAPNGAPLTAIFNDTNYYGVGMQQDLDAVASNIYLLWQHFDLDSLNNVADDEVNVFTLGMQVKF